MIPVSEAFADIRFDVFHELMAYKVLEILLVASPYDAFVMEENGSLASKITNEYRGLNLSRPPRITHARNGGAAAAAMARKPFDLVMVMPNLEDMGLTTLISEIKRIRQDIPVIPLAHSMKGLDADSENDACPIADKNFIWTGDADLLLALVKSVEDRVNAESDARKAMVRVLLLVEDSPLYRSFFLPLLYKVIVRQTQAVLEEGLNQEHRLLKMRARPKILVADNFEEADALYTKFKPFIFGVMSDARYPMHCRMTADAGVQFLSKIRADIPHLPLLMLSSEPENREKAGAIQAVFLDKNVPTLGAEIMAFFQNYLGFGDFVFRLPDKREIGRASNLRTMEEILPRIPDEPFAYHMRRNHFYNWFMARSEIGLAMQVSRLSPDVPDAALMKRQIVSAIRDLRKWRQKGVITQFRPDRYDPDIFDFVKIGQGAIGGKALGLAFASHHLREAPELQKQFPGCRITIPKTLALATDCFDEFIRRNRLDRLERAGLDDATVARRFMAADLPARTREDLRAYLSAVNRPLSVRSSSLLEDAHYQPFAGLYKTHMIPNIHPDFQVRRRQLETAVKLVCASTFFQDPQRFARSAGRGLQQDSMAVLIQQIAGQAHGGYFYPAISGVASSVNFYPLAPMRPEEGIAIMALGMGKGVVEGEKALRFCPARPNMIPQFSTVDDILANAQQTFYALRIDNCMEELGPDPDACIEKRDVADAGDEFPVRLLSSVYIPEEHRIRDGVHPNGFNVITFARILKHRLFPLPELIAALLDWGRKGMGCPVEFEFSVDLNADRRDGATFFLLQMRPMAVNEEGAAMRITADDIRSALCRSTRSLGNGSILNISDIIYVRPDTFRSDHTVKIAGEISRINGALKKEKRTCLLIGPGRWGSADRWLGIPVQWRDISEAGAIIELRNRSLKADASQGSHFFQNITARGVHYLTVTEGSEDVLDWPRIQAFPIIQETDFVRHARTDAPLVIKSDGKTSESVILTFETNKQGNGE